MMPPLPTTLPVMTLRDSVLLPDSMLLIYVFTQRQRQLLADTLRGDRLFIVANEGHDKQDTEGWLAGHRSIGTSALVRMSILSTDGSSTALLQGMQRLLLETVETGDPYPKAHARPLPSTFSGDAELESRLRQQIWELLALLRVLYDGSISDNYHDALAKRDLESLVNVTIQEFCQDADLQQHALETLDTAERARQAIRCLQEALLPHKVSSSQSNYV